MDSEINAITIAYITKLGLKVCRINVRTQNINSFSLEIFKMVLASFQIKNKLRKARFFQEIFLLAKINMKMIIEIFFFSFSNKNI